MEIARVMVTTSLRHRLLLMLALLGITETTSIPDCPYAYPPVINDSPTELSASSEESVILHCCISNFTSNFTVWWYKGNDLIYIKTEKEHSSDNVRLRHVPAERNANTCFSVEIAHPELSDAGEYTCRLTTARGSKCKKDKIFTFTVNYPPSVDYIGPRTAPYWSSAEPGKIFYNESDDAILTCTGRGKPEPNVDWRTRDADGNWNSKSLKNYRPPDYYSWRDYLKWYNLTIPNVSRAHSGIYFCYTSNSQGQSDEAVELIVQYAPEVEAHETDVRLPPDSSITLTCEVNASPPASTFYWLRNGVRVPSDQQEAETNAFVITQLEPERDYANYTCVVINSVGTGNASIELSGKPSAPVILNTNQQGQYRRSFELMWRPPPGIDESGSIITTGYDVYWQRVEWTIENGQPVVRYFPDDPMSDALSRVDISKRSIQYTFYELTENSTYTCRVCSVSYYGKGDCVNYTFYTSAEDPTTTPQSTTVTPLCGEYERCEWRDPAALSSGNMSRAFVLIAYFQALVASLWIWWSS